MSAHRAAHLLHSTLSIASSSALSHDISRHLKLFLTVSVQFFHGILLLFRTSGTQCNIWLALLSLSMCHTWIREPPKSAHVDQSNEIYLVPHLSAHFKSCFGGHDWK